MLNGAVDLGAVGVTSIALGAMWGAEWIAPMVVRRTARGQHAARNIAVGAAAGLTRAVVVTGALAYITVRAQAEGAGLLRPLDGTAAGWVLSFLVLDLWNYGFHVMCHKCPALWRFHTVHHTDTEPDATTALRFHFGEVLAQGAGYLIVLPLAGITMPQLLLYEAVLMASSVFHHANVRLPAAVERVLGPWIVTPGMHIVHHSRWVGQTDSNYSAVLSIWDWLFETRRQGDPRRMEYGLDGYGERDHATLRGLLIMPVGRVRSGPGRPPEAVEKGAERGVRERERGRTLAA